MRRMSLLNRLLSLALCAILVLSLMPGLPLAANAAEELATDDDGNNISTNAENLNAFAEMVSGTTEGDVQHSYDNGFCVNCSADYEPAAMNADGWYEISNGGNMFWFAQQVNAGNLDMKAVLTGNIDLEGREWTPIGQNVIFGGIIDGKGYSISGLSITNSNDHIGFIGHIQNGGVKDLTISGSIQIVDALYCGLIIGRAVDSVLYNCIGTGSVTVTGLDTSSNVADTYGGLVGIVNHGVILNCAAQVDLSLTAPAATNPSVYVGGIVGYLTVVNEVPSSGTCLLNSYSTGDIYVNMSANDATIGGLAGYIWDDAVNNYFLGTIQFEGGSTVDMGYGFGLVKSDVFTDYTFGPLYSHNYIPEGTTAVGSGDQNACQCITGEVYNLGGLASVMNANLEQVNEVVTGHKGILSGSQWAELFVKFGGEEAFVSHWINQGETAVLCMNPMTNCYCDTCDAYYHVFLGQSGSIAKTCQVCGVVEGDVPGHGVPVFTNNGDTHDVDYPCCDELDGTDLPHKYTDYVCVCGAVSADAVAYIVHDGSTVYYGRLEDAIAAANPLTNDGTVNAGVQLVLIKDAVLPDYQSYEEDKLYNRLKSGAHFVIEPGVTLTVGDLFVEDDFVNNGTVKGVDENSKLLFRMNYWGERYTITGDGQWLVTVRLEYGTVHSGHFERAEVWDGYYVTIAYSDDTPITGTVYDYTGVNKHCVTVNGESHTHTYGVASYESIDKYDHTMYLPCTACPFTLYKVANQEHDFGEDGYCDCNQMASYDILVNDVWITAGNMADVLGDGTVRYEPAANTLVLDNARIENAVYHEEDSVMGVALIAQNDLNIRLVGDNIISAAEGGQSSVAIICGGDLTITGDGTLNAQCVKAYECASIFTEGKLTVDASATVTVNDFVLCDDYSVPAGFDGIICYGYRNADCAVSGNVALTKDVTVKGTGDGDDLTASFTVLEGATLTIADGVTLTVADTESAELFNTITNNGKVILEGTGTITNLGQGICTETATHCLSSDFKCLICGADCDHSIMDIITGTCPCGYQAAATCIDENGKVTCYDDPIAALEMAKGYYNTVRLYQNVTLTESLEDNTACGTIYLHGHTITVADGCTMQLFGVTIDGSDGNGGKAGAVVGNVADGLLYSVELSNITVTNTHAQGYAIIGDGVASMTMPTEGVVLNGGAADIYVSGEYFYVRFQNNDYRGEPIHIAADGLRRIASGARVEWFTCDEGFAIVQDADGSRLFLRYDIATRQAELTQERPCSTAQPTLTVYDGENLLVEGTHYTVTWPVDLITRGEKTVTVSGMGDYGGTMTLTYTVHDHKDEDNGGRCDFCDCLMQSAKLSMASVSLNGNIAINYYMLLSDEVLADETAYMQFTLADGEIIKISVSEGVKHEYHGETYYVFSCAVAAKEMTDDVICQFFYEGGSTAPFTYNVRTYANNILQKSQNEDMKALVKAMLHYGAASQIHFGYNTDNLANAELAAPDYSGVNIEGFNAAAGQGTELARFYSASLILKSETTLRFFFTGPITATYNGQNLEVKQRGSLYYVDVVGISAKDLDEDVTITINDGTNTADVTYNPMVYCAAVQNDTTGTFDQEMKDLVSALYLYNQAANTYFKEN